MFIRRVVAIFAVIAVVASLPLGAQDEDKKDKSALTKDEQQDARVLVGLADSMGEALPSEFPVTWRQNHFVKAQNGQTFIPFTLEIDPTSLSSPGVVLYVRAVKKGVAAPPPEGGDKKSDEMDEMMVEHPWDDIEFLDVPADGLVARGLALSGGEYELFVGVKELSTENEEEIKKTSVFRRDLSVPDFTKPELAISSIIVADGIEAVEPLAPEVQRANPYTFVTMKVTPSLDSNYQKTSELTLLFWVYGVQPDALQKPDVQIDYSFHQKLPEGEKYFNKTAPQVLNATSAMLPAEFDLSAGHLVPGMLNVPLASFPPGDYRCEVRVTDKLSGKSLTQNVAFNVAG
jgi:hypothetical protein